jgi:predicted kinase
MLTLVCGLIGVGKTTVSKRIAEKSHGIILRTDVIRLELYPKPTNSDPEVQHVYDELLKRAETILKNGDNLVLDATFYQLKNRERAQKLAKRLGVQFKIVEVVCTSDDLVKSRIEKRVNDESLGNFTEYLTFKPQFNAVEEDKILIDNSGSIEQTYKQIDNYF